MDGFLCVVACVSLEMRSYGERNCRLHPATVEKISSGPFFMCLLELLNLEMFGLDSQN